MHASKPFLELRRKIVFEHLEKFRDSPSMTIAKILFRDHPLMFDNIDNARTFVRMYRGKLGNHHRETVKETKFYQDV